MQCGNFQQKYFHHGVIMCIHNPCKILTPRSDVRWHISSTLSKTFIMSILMIIFEASSRWQKECMNKNLLHQQSTVKTGPRLMNCTLCHDWSGVNEASMIRVDSNCRTYIIYTLHRFWMEDTSGQNITHSTRKSSSWYLLRVVKQVHPWSSKFIRTLGTPVTYKSRLQLRWHWWPGCQVLQDAVEDNWSHAQAAHSLPGQGL